MLANTKLGNWSDGEKGKKGKKEKEKKAPLKRIIFDVIEQESDQ